MTNLPTASETDEELARIEAKRIANVRAALRQKSKHGSIINWQSFRQTGKPIRYTPENRSAEKEDALISDAERIAAGGHTTKNKRRRLEKAKGAQAAPLNMLRIGASRHERRKNRAAGHPEKRNR